MLRSIFKRRYWMMPAACAIFCLALAGCQDGQSFTNISPAFTGPYVGLMSSNANPGMTRQETIGFLAAIRAEVFADGRVELTVTSGEGVSTAAGGVFSGDQFTASGVFQGDRVQFGGSTDFPAGGFGQISGGWTNLDTGERGTWTVVQQGVSNSVLVDDYTGTFTAGMLSGPLIFTINTAGGIIGQATGLDGGMTVTNLTGGISFDNDIIMTGTTPAGRPVWFSGRFNAGLTRVTGLLETGADPEVLGNWTATR